MKQIFNWLQRKLHRSADYKMLSLEQEMKSITKRDPDDQMLLDQETLLLNQETLVEMLDGWHDGILAIGTFGLDQLGPFSSTEDENSIHGGGREDSTEEEEEEDGENSFRALEAFERELEALKDSLSGMYDDEMPKYCPLNDDAVGDAGEEKRMVGRRTTLADLFLADSTAAATNSSGFDAAVENLEKKPVFRSKPSFATKLLPGKPKDSRPTTKLRRVGLSL